MAEKYLEKRARERKAGNLPQQNAAPLKENKKQKNHPWRLPPDGVIGKSTDYLSFAQRIKEETRNGEELLHLLLDIARADIKGGASVRERMQAAQILLDRAYGKAVDRIEVKVDALPSAIDVASWSEEELKQARDAARMLDARAEAAKDE